MSERKAPISIDGFQKMVERVGVRANLGFQVHAHMLRHACGFKLANDGIDTRTIQAYLGHRDIRTVRYTELSPVRGPPPCPQERTISMAPEREHSVRAG